MTMMCTRCYLEGRRVPVGAQVTKDPPFAFMVYEGESRCTSHIPVPAVVESAAPSTLPEQFPPLTVVAEEIVTDNIYVVEEGTKPTAKKTPAKKAQQRKRTKS